MFKKKASSGFRPRLARPGAGRSASAAAEPTKQAEGSQESSAATTPAPTSTSTAPTTTPATAPATKPTTVVRTSTAPTTAPITSSRTAPTTASGPAVSAGRQTRQRAVITPTVAAPIATPRAGSDVDVVADGTAENPSAAPLEPNLADRRALPDEPLNSTQHVPATTQQQTISVPSLPRHTSTPIQAPENPSASQSESRAEPRPEAPSQPESQPSQAIARSAVPPSPEQAPAPETETPEPPQQPAAPPARKRGRPRKVQRPPREEGEEEGEGGEGQTAPPPKKRRKRKQARKQTANGEGEGEDQGEGSEPKPRRRRAATPDDAENQVIDAKAIKMSDLTKDLRMGKKFSRHDVLRERERQERLDKAAAKARAQLKTMMGDSPGPARGGDGDADSEAGGGATAVASSAPVYRVEGGQIRLDDRSVLVDRHARDEVLPTTTIEEDEFTRKTTSNSYRKPGTKLNGPNRWTDDETETFYDLLSVMGTDFESISHCIPGKNGRAVKLKFNYEDRRYTHRVDWALGKGRKPYSTDLYKKLSGRELGDPREVYDAMEARQKELDVQLKLAEDKWASEAHRKKGPQDKGKKPAENGDEPNEQEEGAETAQKTADEIAAS